jgi:hypothetical protein
MGKSSSAPAAPDPYQSAQAQYQFGTQAAAYNKALGAGTTIGPTGQQTMRQTGTDPNTGAPIYTNTTSLSPAQQAIFNLQQANQTTSGQTAAGLAGQAQRSLGQPLPGNVAPTSVQMGINTANVPGIIGAGDLNNFTRQQQQAAYANQTQYLDPQFGQQKEQLDAQLQNAGAHPGDPAYNNAMTLFNNQKQQAYQSAFNNSQQTGLAAQQALYGESANTNQQMFGQSAAEQQAANAAAGQQYGQELQGLQTQLALRDQPLNEYNAAEGGVSANLPSFGLGGSGGGGGGGAVSAPDIMQAFQNQYQGQLAGYNANVASTNADVGAGASLAASYLMYLALA